MSGARELADRVAAKLYLSDEGPAEWKYQFADQYDHESVKDGDSFMIGNIKFDVLHTPGHTPERHFVSVDRSGWKCGQTDGDLHRRLRIRRFNWSARLVGRGCWIGGHRRTGGPRPVLLGREIQTASRVSSGLACSRGGESACGKGLGAIPSSTVGYEKLFNPALQFTDEEKFVKYILSDQPEAPKYFAVMKRVNKEGPKIIGNKGLPESQPINELNSALDSATVIDLSPSKQFADGHIAGSINIPTSMLAGWAGWVVDYSKPAYLIANPSQLPEATRVLRKIGLDDVRGYFDVSKVREAGLATESYETGTPNELAARIQSGEVKLIDVRSDEEWKSGRIAEAEHKFLGRLTDNISEIESVKPIVTQCQTGGRSAIAASILQAAGREIINMTGGFGAWSAAGLGVDSSDAAACETGLKQYT